MDREFLPPGPGTWTLETTHMSGALSPFTNSAFVVGMPRGFKEMSARYGLLMSHLQPAVVNGFIYMQNVPAVGSPADSPPPDWAVRIMSRVHPTFRKLTRACVAAFADRIWREDLARWDAMKPDSIERNTELQRVALKTLTDVQLAEHIASCWRNLEEMIYRHHLFSIPATAPLGVLLALVAEHSDVHEADVMKLLIGSTPVSAGAGSDRLQELVARLQGADVDKSRLAGSPEEVLDAIGSISPEVRVALDDYVELVGSMVVTGYCVTERTVRETPELIVSRIRQHLSSGPLAADGPSEEDVRAVREQLAPEIRGRFDETLADARDLNRVRDERGVFNDIWAAGVARAGLLEAGRRLAGKGTIERAELILEADNEEVQALLMGSAEVSGSELAARHAWRMSTRIEDLPAVLGPEPAPLPSIELLPAALRPSFAAMVAVMDNMDDAETESESTMINGVGVSDGSYEGTARLVMSPADFDRLEQGDVLVTRTTSAAFNAVLPMLGALVTDRGGALSHAAIVSREYGIPGVVSTRVATTSIRDGARVRVDGTSGEVSVL